MLPCQCNTIILSNYTCVLVHTRMKLQFSVLSVLKKNTDLKQHSCLEVAKEPFFKCAKPSQCSEYDFSQSLATINVKGFSQALFIMGHYVVT